MSTILVLACTAINVVTFFIMFRGMSKHCSALLEVQRSVMLTEMERCLNVLKACRIIAYKAQNEFTEGAEVGRQIGMVIDEYFTQLHREAKSE